jgi:hypothetical protein
MCRIAFLLLLVAGGWAVTQEPPQAPRLLVKSSAFKTLVNPDCSHCRDEAKRRAAELRPDDRVLCWVRDTKGRYDGGAIPIRFFLNPYRVISDSYGVFVYDPDAGYARGFAPSYDFSFHGWRNGVMVMKHKDGTLFSCLTGVAFDGLRKGERLKPVATVVSDWGFWLEHYPGSVAYHMYDKYQPVELPASLNEDSVKSRGPLDKRLSPETPVLGVSAGEEARAFPLEALTKVGLLERQWAGGSCVVLWEEATKTAAAYRPLASPPPGGKGEPRKVTLFRDDAAKGKPLTDRETGSRWDITGRAREGQLKGWTLEWLDGTQVKWFAWAAEHPKTTIDGL